MRLFCTVLTAVTKNSPTPDRYGGMNVIQVYICCAPCDDVEEPCEIMVNTEDDKGPHPSVCPYGKDTDPCWYRSHVGGR